MQNANDIMNNAGLVLHHLALPAFKHIMLISRTLPSAFTKTDFIYS